MSLTVLGMSLMVEQLWDSLPGSPYFASPAHVGLTLLILCVGALLAFMMVWVEFTVIAQTSALTFMVAGTFKEVVTGQSGAMVVCSCLGRRFVPSRLHQHVQPGSVVLYSEWSCLWVLAWCAWVFTVTHQASVITVMVAGTVKDGDTGKLDCHSVTLTVTLLP